MSHAVFTAFIEHELTDEYSLSLYTFNKMFSADIKERVSEVRQPP